MAQVTDTIRVLVGESPKREYGYQMREKVFLNVELRQRESVSPHLTIEHKPIETYTELSITADIYEGTRDIGGGQAIDALREIANDLDSQPRTFGRERLRRIVDLWERWHLNGMRAACIHQRDTAATVYRVMPDYGDNDKRWEILRSLYCPEGYSYGHSWLVEPLPEDIEREIRATFAFPGWLAPFADEAASKGKSYAMFLKR